MDNTKSSATPFFIIYVLGALISLTLAAIATWPDLEAAFYGFDRRASTSLQNLHCPVLLNKNETGVVSVKISNTTEHKLAPTVRADFSSALTPISTLDSVELAPGESKTVEWTIGPDNVDLKRFIFSRVLIYASYPLPDREAACGTFVLDLPVRGSVLVWMMALLGLAGIGIGLFVLRRSKPLSNRLERSLNLLTFLGILIAVLMFVGLAGWWVQAVLLLAVTLITIVITINNVSFRWSGLA